MMVFCIILRLKSSVQILYDLNEHSFYNKRWPYAISLPKRSKKLILQGEKGLNFSYLGLALAC